MMKKLASKHSSHDIERSVSLFFGVRALMRTQFAQRKTLHPYTWPHVEAMLFIRSHEGPAMRALAEYLSIAAPSATSLVSPLIRGELVRRERDARDARASRLYLTKKGATFLAKTQMHGHKVSAELFAALSSKDLAALSRLLEQVLSSKGRKNL